MDYESFSSFASLPVTPHVLIIPSELRYFVKVLTSRKSPPLNPPNPPPAMRILGAPIACHEWGSMGSSGQQPAHHKHNPTSPPNRCWSGGGKGVCGSRWKPQMCAVTPQEVLGCVCINPGRLTKGRAAGTYGQLCLQPRWDGEQKNPCVASRVVRI